MPKDTMEQVNEIKEDILENYDRLGLEDKFTFACGPDVPCFTACCRDINIFLTPYDVLRLKNGLGISSEEFIQKYTLAPEVNAMNRIPILVLKMSDNEEKTCQFLGEKGCTVYHDRPWSCRMYPLGFASQKSETNPDGEEFYYLMKEEFKCKGHGLGNEMSVQDYLKDQDVELYNEMNELFTGLTLHPFFNTEQVLAPQQAQMFYMASYNLDMFKRFLFNSKFFEIMVVPEGTEEKIRNDEVELLKFAMLWLRYSLFGEGPIRVKKEVVEAKRKEFTKKEMEKQRAEEEKKK